jgi:hypothetical protein
MLDVDNTSGRGWQPNREPAPMLPLNVFGDHWAQWIEDAAAAVAPVDCVAAALLAAASPLIGHARWVQAWEGWKEPPHLWCGVIGDSGDCMSLGAYELEGRILPAIERRMLADFPEAPPLMLSDVTIERLTALLASPALKGVLITCGNVADWPLAMNAYGNRIRAFWLEAYGGRRYRINPSRSAEPIVIPRLSVSLRGSMQSTRVAEVIRDADDSLLTRFMWFLAGSCSLQHSSAAGYRVGNHGPRSLANARPCRRRGWPYAFVGNAR